MEKRVYLIFAGVNGAGKSTLYAMCDLNLIPKERVNSDEILKDMGGDWRNPAEQAAAMKEAVKRIRENFEKGISFNQETTLAGNSIINNIRLAKKKGYTVCMYYVGVDSVDIAVERVKQREQKGGHGISEKDIRRRYDKSLENLAKVIPYCDTIEVFDNTKQFRRVASFFQGKLQEKNRSCKWFNKVLAAEQYLMQDIELEL